MASTVSELVDVLPKLAACRRSEMFASNSSRTEGVALVHAKASAQFVGAADASLVPRDVDREIGIPTDAVTALMKEARRIVIAARGALS